MLLPSWLMESRIEFLRVTRSARGPDELGLPYAPQSAVPLDEPPRRLLPPTGRIFEHENQCPTNAFLILIRIFHNLREIPRIRGDFG